MQFPNYFADADANFDEADFVIFGIPYDKTSSFRKGSIKAPDDIRKASWNFETYNLRTDVDIKDLKVHDYGNLDVTKDNPSIMIKKVRGFTSKILEKNKFPIAIGGEHSVTSGIIQAYPKDIAVLILDAHMDFRNIYENEKYNHACVTKRISDHVSIKNIVVLGARSAEKEEYIDAKNQNLFYIDSFYIKKNGIKKAINEIESILKNKKIYLTLDIDAIDPSYAPGTGTPEPFGITPFDVIEIIDSFYSNLIGFDVVEVCPNYDNGEASIIAAKIIRNVIEKSSLVI